MGRKKVDRTGGLSSEMYALFGPESMYRTKEGPEYQEELLALPRLYKNTEKRKAAKLALVKGRVLYMYIPCGRGRGAFGPGSVYIHGQGRCAYTGKGLKIRRELLAIPGVLTHQTGHEEFSVVFSPEVFEQVAQVVKARRKRGRGASRARIESAGHAAVGGVFQDGAKSAQ
jgi:hypothetical protein